MRAACNRQVHIVLLEQLAPVRVRLPAERLELLRGVLLGGPADGGDFRDAFLLLAQVHQSVLLHSLLLFLDCVLQMQRIAEYVVDTHDGFVLANATTPVNLNRLVQQLRWRDEYRVLFIHTRVVQGLFEI